MKILFALTLFFSMHVSSQSAPWQLTFNDSSEADNWFVVNDTVMGGRSSASARMVESGLSFTGELSLENSGGFASIRRVLDQKVPVSGVSFSLRVKGDGRPYQLRFRPSGYWSEVAYAAIFETENGEWQTIDIALEGFVPVYRGRKVIGAPDFDPSDMEYIGFMLADKRAGDFSLTIGEIWQAKE